MQQSNDVWTGATLLEHPAITLTYYVQTTLFHSCDDCFNLNLSTQLQRCLSHSLFLAALIKLTVIWLLCVFSSCCSQTLGAVCSGSECQTQQRHSNFSLWQDVTLCLCLQTWLTIYPLAGFMAKVRTSYSPATITEASTLLQTFLHLSL